MNNELTNLLPQDRQRILVRGYMVRICVISTVLITVLTLSAAILIIPTYILLDGNANAKREELARIESDISSADEAELSVRLNVLAINAATLVALSASKSVTTVLRQVLDISRPGIILTSFSYLPPDDKGLGTIAVSGSAATRDSLRSYQLTLQKAEFARSAVLPVSAYAKDSEIPFTITVTLAP